MTSGLATVSQGVVISCCAAPNYNRLAERLLRRCAMTDGSDRFQNFLFYSFLKVFVFSYELVSWVRTAAST